MSITKWKDFSYKILSKVPKYGRISYTIEKLSGEWSTKDDLINLCDNKFPGSYNFGGVVNINHNENIATVDVYID
jgi:hypothetical protein